MINHHMRLGTDSVHPSELPPQFLAPERLLGQPLSLLVNSEQTVRLRSMIANDAIEGNALFAFTLPARADVLPLDVCVHTMSGVLILEFESSGRGDDPLLHPAA